MQSLPDIPAERREDAARAISRRAAADFLPAEQAEIARQVLAILDDRNSPICSRREAAPKCRSSAASRARAPSRSRSSGQVDRLAVTADAVLIADYKTDRAVPTRLDEAEPYVAQLALYRAVLARLYPAKTVRAALIFTEGPTLMELPGAAMDAALAKALSQHVTLR